MNRRRGSGVLVDMYDKVRVDEKWSYVMKDGTEVYLHPADKKPKPPSAQNKRFITKFMFLVAVGRPRKICDRVWFDGKIGIWSIVDIAQEKRDRKNCKNGI
ncbi:unnamed protein product [Discosporangium mesarthrocarpum]